MEIPSVEKIIQVMKSKGYAVFDGPNYNLNMVGIRSKSTVPNSFDDLMILFYRDNKNEWIVKSWKITTDPGLYWLQHPATNLGTAIFKEGQYRGAYKLGLHKGQYTALIQAKPITVYRDNNRDLKFDKTKTDTGMFGINIHCAAWKGESVNVNKWSAGCQVFANWDDFQEFLSIAKKGLSTHPSSLTYTLLNENDF